jgi:hypothetical protein
VGIFSEMGLVSCTEVSSLRCLTYRFRTGARITTSPFSPTGLRPLEGSGHTASIFQDLRVHDHDKKRESTEGNPPSGHKTPHRPCLVLSTPPAGQPTNPAE